MFTVYATNMLHAQTFELTVEQRAELIAKADWYRSVTGTTGKTRISVPVHDAYVPELKIGRLDYMF